MKLNRCWPDEVHTLCSADLQHTMQCLMSAACQAPFSNIAAAACRAQNTAQEQTLHVFKQWSADWQAVMDARTDEAIVCSNWKVPT